MKNKLLALILVAVFAALALGACSTDAICEDACDVFYGCYDNEWGWDYEECYESCKDDGDWSRMYANCLEDADCYSLSACD